MGARKAGASCSTGWRGCTGKWRLPPHTCSSSLSIATNTLTPYLFTSHLIFLSSRPVPSASTLFLLPDSEPTNYLLSDSHVPLSPSEGARRLRLRQRQRGYPIEVIDERSRPTSGGQGHSSGEQGRERWKEGDLVRSWDQIVEWDDDCVPEQVLQR